MAVDFNPYLSFRGRAREALEFYRSVLGGEVQTTTFAEGGMTGYGADPEQLMHGVLSGPLQIMAADVPSEMPLGDDGPITLSLSGDDEATLRGYWDGLTVGGVVTLPLERAPWGAYFGQFTDRFGIGWMVNITPAA